MLVVVGRVARAHGVRGLVGIEVRTDSPERHLAVGSVLTTEPPERGPLTVVEGRVHSGRLVLAFSGVVDRAAAQALRDTMLLAEVDPAERPEDPEEFYDRQLVGLAVTTSAGAAVGEICDVLHLPGQDVLVVLRPGAADGPGTEVLVPFVAAIVPEVDLDAGRVVIDPPPGLLEDGP